MSRLPLDHFAELTAYSCASGYHGYAFDRVLRDPAQSAALRHAASGLPEPHLELAEALLRDPEALRADVLAFLDLCRPVFFGALWAETEPSWPAPRIAYGNGSPTTVPWRRSPRSAPPASGSPIHHGSSSTRCTTR